MANKNKILTVRLGAFEQQKLSQGIEASGCSKGREGSKSTNYKKKKKPNNSDYIRWLICHGEQPIPREHYSQILRVHRDLILLGGLLNQLMRHSNREIKILNDKDLYDENNKGFLERLEHLEKVVLEISDDLNLMKSIMHETCKIEAV